MTQILFIVLLFVIDAWLTCMNTILMYALAQDFHESGQRLFLEWKLYAHEHRRSMFSARMKPSQHAGSGSSHVSSFSGAMTSSVGILNYKYESFSHILVPPQQQYLLKPNQHRHLFLSSPKCKPYSTFCFCWQHSLPPPLLQQKHLRLEALLNAVNIRAFPQALSLSPPTNGVHPPEQAPNARRSMA